MKGLYPIMVFLFMVICFLITINEYNTLTVLEIVILGIATSFMGIIPIINILKGIYYDKKE